MTKFWKSILVALIACPYSGNGFLYPNGYYNGDKELLSYIKKRDSPDLLIVAINRKQNHQPGPYYRRRKMAEDQLDNSDDYYVEDDSSKLQTIKTQQYWTKFKQPHNKQQRQQQFATFQQIVIGGLYQKEKYPHKLAPNKLVVQQQRAVIVSSNKPQYTNKIAINEITPPQIIRLESSNLQDGKRSFFSVGMFFAFLAIGVCIGLSMASACIFVYVKLLDDDNERRTRSEYRLLQSHAVDKNELTSKQSSIPRRDTLDSNSVIMGHSHKRSHSKVDQKAVLKRLFSSKPISRHRQQIIRSRVGDMFNRMMNAYSSNNHDNTQLSNIPENGDVHNDSKMFTNANQIQQRTEHDEHALQKENAHLVSSKSFQLPNIDTRHANDPCHHNAAIIAE